VGGASLWRLLSVCCSNLWLVHLWASGWRLALAPAVCVLL
jgi:hypothetical protein